MIEKKFDPKKLEKLNNPDRLKDLNPEYVWSKLNLQNPKVLLDIGAGTGFYSIFFAQYTEEGQVYACDISDIMVQWMKDNIIKDNPRITPIKMGERNVPLKDGIADLVYMINLHHELEDPLGIIKESYRLLKRGGKLFIADWKKEEMDQGPPLEIRCTVEEIEDQLLNGGFGDIRIYNELPKHFLIITEKDK